MDHTQERNTEKARAEAFVNDIFGDLDKEIDDIASDCTREVQAIFDEMFDEQGQIEDHLVEDHVQEEDVHSWDNPGPWFKKKMSTLEHLVDIWNPFTVQYGEPLHNRNLVRLAVAGSTAYMVGRGLRGLINKHMRSQSSKPTTAPDPEFDFTENFNINKDGETSMSRFSVPINEGQHKGGSFCYGFDRVPVPGYFYQVFDEEGQLVEDADTRPAMGEKQVSRSQVCEQARLYGAPRRHQDQMVADLPIE